MNGQSLEWDRVAKFLRDAARRNGGEAVAALDRARAILDIAGECSYNRVMAQRIGLAALHGPPLVIAPACPDYGHDGTRYNFKGGLGTGVSLLATRHLHFLEPLLRSGVIRAELLYADQECEDTELCRVSGIDRDVFRERVRASAETTRVWCREHELAMNVGLMTERFPRLCDEEMIAMDRLLREQPNQLRSDALSRQDMYRRINWCMPFEEMLRRTARTAAQYVALGNLIAHERAIVTNHTTVNLRWYRQTDVGVIHNPVAVY